MEYIQTVLVQIEAALIDEASRPGGLLDALDDHRNFLQQQPGFQDMRVTRSINAEGNVLLVIETRWQDDSSLVDYETREPTVASVINRHPDLIVPESLQVLDMEALRTEARPPDEAAHAHERLTLPLAVPLAALAFALLVIYGLSRVYLELSNSEAATGLAAGIAIGILFIAWYLAARPSVPGWQMASIAVLAAAALTGGALFAVVREDEGEATEGTPTAVVSPTAVASPTPGGPPAGNVFAVAMIPTIAFDVEEMVLPANTEVTVRADNQDGAVLHNWAAYTDDTARELIAGTELCAAPCLEEVTFTTPAAGEYFFRCDVHPIQMVGTLRVE